MKFIMNLLTASEYENGKTDYFYFVLAVLVNLQAKHYATNEKCFKIIIDLLFLIS